MNESQEREKIAKRLVPLIQELGSVAHDLLRIGDHEKLHEVTGHLTKLNELRSTLNAESITLSGL